MTLTAGALGVRPFDNDHDIFRRSVQQFLRVSVAPVLGEWRRDGRTPASFFRAAGEQGFLGTAVPEALGGGGVEDLRFVQVLLEETVAVGAVGLAQTLALHIGVCVPALLAHAADDQQHRWVPALATGDHLIVAAGSARTHLDGGPVMAHGVPGAGAATHLLATLAGGDRACFLSRDAPTVEVVPVIGSLGGGDGSPADVRIDASAVPDSDTFGEASAVSADTGRDFDLWSAVVAVAAARGALALTLAYVDTRKVFGRRLAEFENTRNRLAELSARLATTEFFVDGCVSARSAGRLTARPAAAARLTAAGVHDDTVDCGLQLHGGYGYMSEYPISFAYADARYLREGERAASDARTVLTGSLD